MAEPVHLTAGETLRKLLDGMRAHIPALTTVNTSVQFIYSSDKRRSGVEEIKNEGVSLLCTDALMFDYCHGLNGWDEFDFLLVFSMLIGGNSLCSLF